jgi:hypothetical protein
MAVERGYRLATARHSATGDLASGSLGRLGWLCAPGALIKLTEEREITPYTWVSPDDDDGVASNSIHVRRALSSLRHLRS